ARRRRRDPADDRCGPRRPSEDLAGPGRGRTHPGPPPGAGRAMSRPSLGESIRHRPPLHPLLFAIYPVLFLYGQNLGEVTLGDLVVPIAVVAIGALAVYAVTRLILRSSGRGALAASLLI